MSKRILATDHSLTIRQALQYTFAKEPELSLTVVHQGQAVLDSITRESFDLLLLDYRMPDISGVEICTRCKSNPRTAHIPVLLLLGKNTDPSIVSQVGAQGFVRKPFQTSELLERVAELLRVSVRPLPVTLPSAMKIADSPSIDIEIEVDIAAPVASGMSAVSPPTPFSSPTAGIRGSSAAPSLGLPLMPQRNASSSALIPPPLPTTRASASVGVPPTPMAAHPVEPKPVVASPPTDMMIDDLPYELTVAGGAGIPLRETPAPQPASNSLFFPVSDVLSAQAAPPTIPFTPDYSREPFVSPTLGTPLANAVSMPTPFLPSQESTNKLSNVSPANTSNPSMDDAFGAPSYLLGKPLPPPSYTSPPEHKKNPTLIPPSSPNSGMEPLRNTPNDSIEVLMASPVPLRTSPPEQSKELLLPLEDEPPVRLATPSLGNRSPQHMGDNPEASTHSIFSPVGNVEPPLAIPRIDHLEQTAVVPSVRRQMGQISTPSRPITGLTSDTENQRYLQKATATPLAKSTKVELIPSCPPRHCQLVFGTVLPLHTVAMFLQFADYVQSRLQSTLKEEWESPLLINIQSISNLTVVAWGGSSSALRCFVPAVLECCSSLREEERQQVAESLLTGIHEGVRSSLRRAGLQARISSRPYAMALTQELPELARTSILKLESCLEEGMVVHYQNTSPHESRPSEEQSLLPAKLKLRDLLLRHFTVHTLSRLMEEEFSQPLHEMIPLNLSIHSIFLAVIHHFEQRYQLPELAEAIRDKHPAFPTQPFEDFPDI